MKELSVALHPGYQAAEMKSEYAFAGRDSDRGSSWFSDGAAVTRDAARVESRMEQSMS